MSDDLDWGPKRPPAVGWAGALLILLSLAHIGAIGTFAYIDREAILASRTDQIVVGSVLVLFALQLLAGVAVLRLWRWWRGIAMVLSAAGAALAAANVARWPEVPAVGLVVVGVVILYVVVLVLLVRSRAAFA